MQYVILIFVSYVAITEGYYIMRFYSIHGKDGSYSEYQKHPPQWHEKGADVLYRHIMWTYAGYIDKVFQAEIKQIYIPK